MGKIIVLRFLSPRNPRLRKGFGKKAWGGAQLLGSKRGRMGKHVFHKVKTVGGFKNYRVKILTLLRTGLKVGRVTTSGSFPNKIPDEK